MSFDGTVGWASTMGVLLMLTVLFAGMFNWDPGKYHYKGRHRR